MPTPARSPSRLPNLDRKLFWKDPRGAAIDGHAAKASPPSRPLPGARLPARQPVVLELGGKDPFVLLPGAKVDAIVDVAARAGWGASGQNCIGAERFFVHASLYEEFAAKICAIAAKMRQGPPLNAEGVTAVTDSSPHTRRECAHGCGPAHGPQRPYTCELICLLRA